MKPEDGNQPAPGVALGIVGCLYLMMLVGAVAWLWLSDRLPALSESALGRYGIWPAAAVGLGGGLLGTALLGVAGRLNSVRRCGERVVSLLGPLGESQILALSLLSAVAEEMFFRLAVQEAFGMPVAVALYVLLNTGPGFWAWSWIALAAAILFSGLVQLGFGLLAATAAHAIINYLSLRRILPT